MRRSLIDGNSIGFSAHAGMKLSAGGTDTQAIFGAIKMIRKIRNLRRDAPLLVLWDGRSWRYDMYPAYKETRRTDPKKVAERESYKRQKPAIMEGLRLLGVPQMIANNLEADDLAGILTKKFINKGDTIKLFSGDKDWLQMVQKGVVWEDHRKDSTCSIGSFTDITGFRNGEEFVQGKALQGDTSDNIPGVGGIGEKGALLFMKCYGGVKTFKNMDYDEVLDTYQKLSGKKTLPKAWRQMHPSDKEFDEDKIRLFIRNYKLMDLRGKLPDPQGLRLIKPETSRDKFEKFCAKYGFHSILKDIDGFMDPFLNVEEVKDAA